MFLLDGFVVQGHQKIIGHYRWLRDTAKTEVERERFQRRIMEEYEALKSLDFHARSRLEFSV